MYQRKRRLAREENVVAALDGPKRQHRRVPGEAAAVEEAARVAKRADHVLVGWTVEKLVSTVIMRRPPCCTAACASLFTTAEQHEQLLTLRASIQGPSAQVDRKHALWCLLVANYTTTQQKVLSFSLSFSLSLSLSLSLSFSLSLFVHVLSFVGDVYLVCLS